IGRLAQAQQAVVNRLHLRSEGGARPFTGQLRAVDGDTQPVYDVMAGVIMLQSVPGSVRVRVIWIWVVLIVYVEHPGDILRARVFPDDPDDPAERRAKIGGSAGLAV